MKSVLAGTSRVEQIKDNVGALNTLQFTDEELEVIDEILAG